jgi:hypothetical protein
MHLDNELCNDGGCVICVVEAFQQHLAHLGYKRQQIKKERHLVKIEGGTQAAFSFDLGGEG